MSPKTKFIENEKVLCFHGPLIYEAKCLKVQYKEKEKMYKYFVHYAGWNKNWDEWVAESRILKLNDQSLTRQKELLKSHEVNVQKKKAAKKAAEKKKEAAKIGNKDRAGERSGDEGSRSSTPSTDRSSGGTKRSAATTEEGEGGSKRSKMEPGVDTEEQFMASVEVRIRLPEELKPCLVDDWEAIHRHHKLLTLPARVTAGAILQDYQRSRLAAKGNTPNKESAVVETVAGIKAYFDMMLGKQLLYKYERGQYGDLSKDKSKDELLPASEIYGYIHLVRMFVKLGEMLAFTQLDERSTCMLHYHLQDFLKFLAKSVGSYHSPQDYLVASAEYQRRML